MVKIRKKIDLKKARRKDFQVRNIVTVGDSLGITFPLFWMENVEWLKESERVVLKLNPDSTITISPIRKVSRKKNLER